MTTGGPRADGLGCVAWGIGIVGAIVFLGVFSGVTGVIVICGILGIVLFVMAGFAALVHRSPSEQMPPRGDPDDGSAAHDGFDVAPLAVATSTRREHRVPAPRGTPAAPWVSSSRTTEVVGEYYRQATYETLLQGLPRDGTWQRLDLDADLYPDPGNPHSRERTAVSVWIDGLHAGFLEDENAGRYSPLLRDLAEDNDQYLRVPAKVSGSYEADRRSWRVAVRLDLPEPEDILPRNQMPDGTLEILPPGRVTQVTGENHHMDVLAKLVDHGLPASYAATLRIVHEIRPRSSFETVEVQIDGERVGVLSKATGEQIGPLVELIERAGRVPVVRATVEGNELSAEVKIRVIRAAEADPAWIRELRSIPSAPRAATNLRGESFDWDDEHAAEEGAPWPRG